MPDEEPDGKKPSAIARPDWALFEGNGRLRSIPCKSYVVEKFWNHRGRQFSQGLLGIDSHDCRHERGAGAIRGDSEAGHRNQ